MKDFIRVNAFLEPWSSWLSRLDERVLSTAILGLALYVSVQTAEWAVRRALSDERRPYTVFKDPVFNYTQGAPYIWAGFTVPISYGPHRERAQSTILDAVADYTNEVAASAKDALLQLRGMSLIGSPETHAQVYVSLTEHWVACTLRYVVHARSRRTVKHQLQVKTLKALAAADIEIASPALTVVPYPAERTWKEEA